MTAQSADRMVARFGNEAVPDDGKIGLAASTTVYKGSLIARNFSGYAVPATSTGGNDFSLRVIGVAREKVANSGSAGAKKVSYKRGVFDFANSSSTDALTDADIDEACFAVDDQTVARTDGSGMRPFAGIVRRIEGGRVYVEVGTRPEPGVEDVKLLAGADLSTTGQNLFVKLSSGAVVVCSAAGESPFGVLLNAPASGAVAIVRRRGRCRVIASTTVAIDSHIATTNAGKSKVAVVATVNTSDAGASGDPSIGSHAMGYARVAGTTDALHSVMLEPLGALPSTAA